ncbi:hypothetical protein Mapa_010286 [Marchantia paleacea]|nr:hypothetical protein Mapa_010286 [Marchantia paleacea]
MEAEGNGILMEEGPGATMSPSDAGSKGRGVSSLELQGNGVSGTDLRGSQVGRTIAARPPREGTGSMFLALLVIWTLALGCKIWEGETNLWPVIYGWAFFETVNKVLSFVVDMDPEFLSNLQPRHVDSFLNTAVSLLHSTTISIAVVSLLIEEQREQGIAQMWRHEVLTQKAWPGAHTVLGFSCGYFAYDQWDMLRRRLYKPRAPSVLTHHLVLLTCFVVALFKNSCINYLILTLVCEVHSVFLHLRKVMLLAGANRAWGHLLRIEWLLNWIAFITARCAVHVLITAKLVQDRLMFERGTIELPLASIGMLGLNILNFILGQGLWKAFRRERSGRRDSTKVAED